MVATQPLQAPTPANGGGAAWAGGGSTDILCLGPAGDEPEMRLNDQSVRMVFEGALFRRLLRSLRPLVVVVFAPPATTSDIGTVALERRRRQDMRAVLVDQPGAAGERLAALGAGFDQALDARLSTAELAGRLALLADEARQLRAERLIKIAPGLVLDVTAHELRRSGQTVHLRPREYALLEVLARHHGRTFSRRQLLEAVGARATIRDARTVDVHIRWLREKLADHGPSSAQLVTVRGVGYRLDTPAVRAARGAAVNKTLTNGEQDVDAPPRD